MKTVSPIPARISILLALSLLIGLPLLGIILAKQPLERYLEFPPHSRYVEHAVFSWPVFIGLAAFILSVILPFILRVLFARRTIQSQSMPLVSSTVAVAAIADRGSHSDLKKSGVSCTTNGAPGARRFPVWGWLGLLFGIGAWILAWSRFAWFAPWQTFTFSPLWFSYILVVNALTWRRTGRCMLTHQLRFFLLLFPVSAAFWWLFEYLNRFVQNWYYIGIGSLTPWEYFLFATLPFSTVLPAVLGTFDLLASYPRLSAGLNDLLIISRRNVGPKNRDDRSLEPGCPRPGQINRPEVRPPPFPDSQSKQISICLLSRWIAVVVLIISAAGLAGIGVWPDYLFPLLWLAPLGLLASLQILAGRAPALLAGPARGDWRRIVLLALAALICGIFWEMWNFYSAAKWVYAVPLVNRFHLFEMPILGYAGYLPFGLECALVAELVAEFCAQRTP